MGGYSSGRWHGETTRQTVESSLILSIDRLRRCRALVDPYKMVLSGSVSWPSTTMRETQSIGYRVERSGGGILLSLRYTVNGEAVDEPVEIERLLQHFGGFRWWYRCPLVKAGRECRRRCGKLYLPPGARLFGCRRCYNLTYTSCNESRQFSGLYALLANNTGLSPAAVKKSLCRPDWGL